MRKISAFIVLFAPVFSFSCSRFEEPAGDRRFDDFAGPVLDGSQDPARYTRVIEPDTYVVLGQRPFGYNDLSALVVARSGLVTKTFVVPAAMGLKTGDVVRLHLLCYRAEEEVAGSRLKAAKNSCTDVVIPFAPDGK